MADKGLKSKYLGNFPKITATTIEKKLKRCKKGYKVKKDTKCFRKITFTTFIHRHIQMGVTTPSDFVIGASEKVNPHIKCELQWKVNNE